MFNFLKKAFSAFTKKVEEEPEEETEKIKKVKYALAKPKLQVSQGETVKSEEKTSEEIPEEKPKKYKALAKLEKKVGFLESITKAITEAKISEEYFEKTFSVLETELLQDNVAYAVTQRLRQKLKEDLVGKSLKRGEAAKIIREDLRELLSDIFEMPKPLDILKLAKENKPLVLLFVGVNGVGKTTNMAKVAHYLQKNNLSCVFAASDTFRAASIEQLEEHANKLKIELIKHKYGADPAAVAFDAIKHAQAQKIDVVLIDTAGRQQANADLMAELEKLKRVAKPHATILVVDSLTGNDAVSQAETFNEKIGVDGVILTKTDADEKGGAVISVAQAIQKPIIYLGIGQTYEDLEKFEPSKFVEKII